MHIKPFFNFVARRGRYCKRVFKLMFSKDGSIYIAFPGIKGYNGVISHSTLKANLRSQKVTTHEIRKVTSHDLKFAHHASGIAHFSLDGKAKTLVKKRSVPLNEKRGHLFTVHYDNIKLNKRRLTPYKNEMTLDMKTHSVKCIAWLFSIREVKHKYLADLSFNSTSRIYFGNKHHSGFFLKPRVPYHLFDKCIFLSVEKSNVKLDTNSESFTFIGGLDPDEIANDLTKETTFLNMIYPCTNFKEFKSKFGSLDLLPK